MLPPPPPDTLVETCCRGCCFCPKTLHFSGVKHLNSNGLNVQPVSKLLDQGRVTLGNTRRRINTQNNMVLSDLHSAVPSLPPQHHVCLTGCLGAPLTWSRAPDKLVGQPLCHFHFITGFDFTQAISHEHGGRRPKRFPPLSVLNYNLATLHNTE